MSTRIYVSTLEASYFETQLLGYDNNPPTEGNHTVGDIVLSSVQQNDALGWVCVKAGNPGEWKVICDIVNVKNSINQNKNDISKLAGRVTKTEADIREINNDIIDLNKNVEDTNSDLEDRINENMNNISNLRIDVDTNKGNIKNNLNSINDLRTQIEDAKKTLNNVGNQANTNADDIANIERELIEIDNRLDNTDSNNNSLLNNIQNELNTLKNNVGKEGTTSTPATGIHKELNNLQKEFDELKDLVTDGDNDINSVIQNLQKEDENINKEIDDIKELINGNEANNDEIIEVLQKEIDDNKDDITELQKGVVDNKDDITELQKDVEGNKDDITELQKDVEGNKTEIDDLKQGLIDSLKEKNIDVKDNISWKELFDLLLQGLVKPENPEEPEDPDEPETPENKECTKLEFSVDELVLNVGETRQVQLIVEPTDCTDGVGYKLSKDGIVYVNNYVASTKVFTIRGMKAGNVTLNVNCGTKAISLNITVNPIEEPEDPIEIIIDEITIKVGETYDATKLYNLQEGYAVQYKYSSVIAIEDDHTIVGNEVGTTNLEIICGKIIKNVKVNVIEAENKECTSIRFTESSLKIHIDQVTDLKEILIIQPDGCVDPVEWVADNTILEINNGVIKGLAEGSTKVQARCGDLSVNITITVIPKTTEDLGEGILLYKAGTQYNDTEFRNLCLPNAENSLTSNAICYALHDYSHVWFSYDGYINFNDYDRIEITAYTENSQQQPMIGLGITSVSGQQGYQNSSEWEGTPHGNVVLMYNVTETKYTIPINYTGPGYLLLWMHRNNSGLGRVYITEIRVIPKKTDEPIEIIDDEITIQVGEKYDATKLYKLQEGYNVQYKYSAIIAIESEHTIVGKEVGTTELEIICGGIIKTVTVNVVEPTGGIVLFDNGHHYRTEFGDLVYPLNYVTHVGDIDFNLSTTYCTYAAICFDGYINFNNYDAIAITVHTENTQQTGTQLMVGRGSDPTLIVGAGTPPYTVSYEESTFSTMTNTKTQATYIFSFDALRQENDDMGYLGIRVLRGDADGHVYIDKIVVYRDGEL